MNIKDLKVGQRVLVNGGDILNEKGTIIKINIEGIVSVNYP